MQTTTIGLDIAKNVFQAADHISVNRRANIADDDVIAVDALTQPGPVVSSPRAIKRIGGLS